MKLITASASPRRKLLEQIGLEFEVRTSGAESSRRQVSRDRSDRKIIEIKAQAVWDTLTDAEKEDAVVIGADTIVCVRQSADSKQLEQGQEEKFFVLGKPKDEADAARMLHLLSGRVHQVFTGVTILSKEGKKTFYECTDVHVAKLSDQEIADYIATKDPMDKAGAYGIQGIFARHITGIEGDYNNVVGLPVASVYHELKPFLMERKSY